MSIKGPAYINEDDLLQNAKGIESTVEKTITPPTEQVTNGDAEIWSEGLPTGWNFELDTGSVAQATGRSGSGYSVKITSSEPPGEPSYCYFQGTGNQDEILDVSIWGKVEVNEPPFEQAIIVLDSATLANTTQYWTTGGGWQAMSAGGQLAPNEAAGSNDTGDWTEFSEAIPLPASGEIGLYNLVLGPSAVGYIDDVSIQTQEGASNDIFNRVKLRVKKEDLTDSDTVFMIVDEDDVEILSINGLGTTNKIRKRVELAEISDPPTIEDLNATFDTPANVGAGFNAFINNQGTGYYVWSDGVNWFYLAYYLAVAE